LTDVRQEQAQCAALAPIVEEARAVSTMRRKGRCAWPSCGARGALALPAKRAAALRSGW